MKTLAIIFVHNRPTILQECLITLLGKDSPEPDAKFNQNHKFDEVLIINDGSKWELTDAITRFAAGQKYTLINFNKGQGYATAAEFAFAYTEWRNPERLYWIEQDYIFKPHGIDIVEELFAKYPQIIGFSGYDNPDFYNKHKRTVEFQNIQNANIGVDRLNRELMWKPWEEQTTFGKIYLEKVSNSCGTMFINWKRVNEIASVYPQIYQNWKDITVDKHKEKRNLNDGMMSGGLADMNILAVEHYGGGEGVLYNIKPSVANHVNGGNFDPTVGENSSINGHIVPEGHSFVGSPTWDKTFEETKKILEESKYNE